jgi:hypothetical protein
MKIVIHQIVIYWLLSTSFYILICFGLLPGKGWNINFCFAVHNIRTLVCASSVYYILYTNKSGRHDITEILLKVALNTINQTNQSFVIANWTASVVSSNPVHGEMYSIQHWVIKFISDLQQVGGFLRIWGFPPPIKLAAMI